MERNIIYISPPLPQIPRPPQPKKKRTSVMGTSNFKKFVMLFLLLAFLCFTSWQVFLYIQASNNAARGESDPSRVHISQASEDNVILRPPTEPAIHYQRPNFQAGIVFPEWSPNGYGADWQQQLPTIQAQTGARWIEMTVFFSQTTPNSTQVRTSASTPTLQSFTDGIRAARVLGYHVFVVPLMGVDTPANQWAGTIQFSTYQEEAQWFDSYWQTYKPYIEAATQAGADQLAIGTELVWLQQTAPASLWNTLITRIHSVFLGTLTYDMNWTSIDQPVANWLRNPELSVIGVSEYLPLVADRVRVPPEKIFGLWKTTVKSALDKLALHLDKPLIISEIGYRNSADTLYHSWLPYSTVSPPDPEEQAAACDAALANVIPDPHIVGIFFWGWDNVTGFKLSGQPATQVLNHWYTSSQS